MRPNIIAGMGDGTLPPATTEGGLPIVRYHCGASSSYSSPTTTRPYDCNWALNDCQWKLNGGNQYPACTNLAAVALHFMFFKFARPHHTLKNPYPRTPAMAAGAADHVWSLREIAALLD